jgi:hypothetical protein
MRLPEPAATITAAMAGSIGVPGCLSDAALICLLSPKAGIK